MIGIYKIINPFGKIYIGQSVNIEKRFKTYKALSKNVIGQTKLYRSLKKYGAENHKFEILCGIVLVKLILILAFLIPLSLLYSLLFILV